MIIKNIAPYLKQLPSLGKQLMPGEECDLSEFTQKQRDNCVELQEGFRKGEFVCIGIGQRDRNPQARLREAKARLLHQGEQPLIEVERGRRPAEPEPQRADISEVTPVYETPRPRPTSSTKPTMKIPEGIMEQNEQGGISYRPLSRSTPELESEPEPANVESPTITPDRIRQIMSQRCISFKSNGRKCRAWAVRGYEYCITHMPEELKREYKKQKKQQFFGE